jgi:periplasmic protein TonB
MNYRQQEHRRKATSMGMAVAVNGAIIAAIMLSPLVVQPPGKRQGTTVINVPLKQPPPEIIPPETRDRQNTVEPVFIPRDRTRKFENEKEQVTTTGEDYGTETGTGGTSDFGKGGGSETVREVVEDPPLPPLMHAKRDARYARNFIPDYPSGLLAREIEGEAVLKVLVGIDGRVREAIVMRASHADFGKAAVKQALKEWRFIAATRGGQPVEDWQTIPIRYTINS